MTLRRSRLVVCAGVLCNACGPPPAPEPARAGPPPSAPNPAAMQSALPEAIGASPVCDGPRTDTPRCETACTPTRLWEVEYRKRVAVRPAPLRVIADHDGSVIVGGKTGGGPTYLGGDLLNTGWPRGAGSAFVAKYDRDGRHLWSRLLFEPTADDRKRGARSGIRKLALGEGGNVHVLVSRGGPDGSRNHVVTLTPDGRLAATGPAPRSLPVLLDFLEHDGAAIAMGVRERSERQADLVEIRFEPDGAIREEIRGRVEVPDGALSSQRAHWSPAGLVWTAGLRSERNGSDQGGTLTCPIHSTRQREDGSLVRVSTRPEQRSCSWPLSELVVSSVSSGRTQWMRRFAVPGYRQGHDAAYVDGAGDVFLTGGFTGAAVFGERALCALPLPDGYSEDFIEGVGWDAPCECLRDYADVFLVKVTPDGRTAWARRIGRYMEDQPGPVALSPDGVAVVAVGTAPQPDFAVPRGKPIPPFWSLYAFAPDGRHLWTHPVQSPAVPLVTVREDGVVVVVEALEKDAGLRLTALQVTSR